MSSHRRGAATIAVAEGGGTPMRDVLNPLDSRPILHKNGISDLDWVAWQA